MKNFLLRLAINCSLSLCMHVVISTYTNRRHLCYHKTTDTHPDYYVIKCFPVFSYSSLQIEQSLCITNNWVSCAKKKLPVDYILSGKNGREKRVFFLLLVYMMFDFEIKTIRMNDWSLWLSLCVCVCKCFAFLFRSNHFIFLLLMLLLLLS